MLKTIHQFCGLALHIFQNSYIFSNVVSCPYSRCGLMKVVNNFLKRGPSRYEKVLRINPAIAFAFFTFTKICSSSFSFASRITPRSFCSKLCSSSCLWRVYFSVWECYKVFPTSGRQFLNEQRVAIPETIALMNLCLIAAEVLPLWLLFVGRF